MARCPVCRQDWPLKGTIKVNAGFIATERGTLKIGPVMSAILRELNDADEPIPSDRLLQLVYSDGGPESGVYALHSEICTMNKRLPEIGLRIINTGGCGQGPGMFGTYMLAAIE